MRVSHATKRRGQACFVLAAAWAIAACEPGNMVGTNGEVIDESEVDAAVAPGAIDAAPSQNPDAAEANPVPDATPADAAPPDATPCPASAGRVVRTIGQLQGTYTKRWNWNLHCRAYAFTASSAEHMSCDSEYKPDGTRLGTATFVIKDVLPGLYDVDIKSHHTENRDGKGALFYVNEHSKRIMQKGPSADVWDMHGQYCLSGNVTILLDQNDKYGSDAVETIRLTPR